jgi:hypothetical protein
MVLYETNVCIKPFNMPSPNFGERDRINRETPFYLKA